MSAPSIRLLAGTKAMQRLQQHGLRADLFDFMLGASGGPKWFVLAGLDRVIMPQFFASRTRPLDILGSSAGAFRFACYGQHDPLAAINRLADHYSHTVYTEKPDRHEISSKARDLLDHVLGEEGAQQIVNHPTINTHFAVARSRGLAKFETSPVQIAGLLASAGANYVSRKALRWFFQRCVFSTPSSELQLIDPDGLPCEQYSLTEQNLSQALMASGSIPVVLEGVQNIPGAPAGVYRDGGIVDYHFNLQLQRPESDGLILYPHFFSRPIPGWFDKSSQRQPHHSSYENVLMIVPSDEFVASLPYGKIPDRKDFETMPADQRIAYWQTVLSESDKLGEAFMTLVEKQDISEHLEPINFTRQYKPKRAS